MKSKGYQLLLILHLITGLAPVAQADDAAILREAQDRAEIEALMWRYVRALDSLDADAYVAVFTEDGEFRAGQGATQGREALHAMVAGLAENRADDAPQMFHVIANHRIEFVDENRARYHTYWMTVFGASAGGQPQVAAAGRGIDELVRTDEGWLIHSRDVQPQD
jgi:uncharacterized protein (TIGR02246 family)